MKECRRVRKLLSGYLDNEISGTDDRFVKSHLDICSICNNEYLGFLKVKKLMSGKERKSLPEDYLILRLGERIAIQQNAEDRLLWLVDMGNIARRLIAIPVSVIVLSAIFLFFASNQPENRYSFEEHVLGGTKTTIETAANLILGA